MIEIKVEKKATLTLAQIGMLVMSPYARGHIWKGRGIGDQARKLVELGLLERNPDTPDLYRCTDAGEEVLAPYLRGRV